MNTENQNNNQIPVSFNPANNNAVPTATNSAMNPSQVPNGMGPVPQQGLANVATPQASGIASLNPANSNSVPTGAVSQSQNLVNTNMNQVGVNNSGIASTTVSNTQQVSNSAVPSTSVPPSTVPSSSAIQNTTGETFKENPDETHEVIEVLSSSFDQKNKVNLLTPEQKEALTKKREAAQKEKESYQPAPISKFKRVMSTLVIILLFGIVFFLPDINNYIAEIGNPSKNSDNTPITTGTLKCNLDKVDDKYNLSYSYDFDFTDSKLDRLTYVQATIGDDLLDYDDLNQKLDSCSNLKVMTTGLDGIRITCSLSSGVLTEEQIITYDVLNYEQVTASYVEAGGLFPEFKSDTDIDMIERNMKAAGYTCERVK